MAEDEEGTFGEGEWEGTTEEEAREEEPDELELLNRGRADEEVGAGGEAT